MDSHAASVAAAPAVSDPAQYAQVRDVLARAGYTDEGLAKLLGGDSLLRLRDRRFPALLRRTGGGTPLDTLVRLFILDQAVDAAAAADAFAPMTVDEWTSIGLIARDAEGVRATVQLRCYQGLVLACDFTRRDKGGVRRDYVMSVSPSSLVLLGMTVRRPIRAALDLGTGCGIQAFGAAPHSQRVVAVDTNPRAIAIARFNAGLNGIANVDFREGSLFEPVAGETFDSDRVEPAVHLARQPTPVPQQRRRRRRHLPEPRADGAAVSGGRGLLHLQRELGGRGRRGLAHAARRLVRGHRLRHAGGRAGHGRRRRVRGQPHRDRRRLGRVPAPVRRVDAVLRRAADGGRGPRRDRDEARRRTRELVRGGPRAGRHRDEERRRRAAARRGAQLPARARGRSGAARRAASHRAERAAGAAGAPGGRRVGDRVREACTASTASRIRARSTRPLRRSWRATTDSVPSARTSRRSPPSSTRRSTRSRRRRWASSAVWWSRDSCCPTPSRERYLRPLTSISILAPFSDTISSGDVCG